MLQDSNIGLGSLPSLTFLERLFSPYPNSCQPWFKSTTTLNQLLRLRSETPKKFRNSIALTGILSRHFYIRSVWFLGGLIKTKPGMVGKWSFCQRVGPPAEKNNPSPHLQSKLLSGGFFQIPVSPRVHPHLECLAQRWLGPTNISAGLITLFRLVLLLLVCVCVREVVSHAHQITHSAYVISFPPVLSSSACVYAHKRWEDPIISLIECYWMQITTLQPAKLGLKAPVTLADLGFLLGQSSPSLMTTFFNLLQIGWGCTRRSNATTAGTTTWHTPAGELQVRTGRLKPPFRIWSEGCRGWWRSFTRRRTRWRLTTALYLAFAFGGECKRRLLLTSA